MRFSISLACLASVALAQSSDSNSASTSTDDWESLIIPDNQKACHDSLAFDMPFPPAYACWTEDAWAGKSDTKPCNDAWGTWHAACLHADTEDVFCVWIEEQFAKSVPPPPVPADPSCYTWDAYIYISDSAVCNKEWMDWHDFCKINGGKYRYSVCDDVEKRYQESQEDEKDGDVAPEDDSERKQPIVPDKECWNWAAYDHFSPDQPECQVAWENWHYICLGVGNVSSTGKITTAEWMKWCVPTEHEVMAYLACHDPIKGQEAVCPDEKLLLAKSAEEEGEGQYSHGVVLGSSVGAAATFAALYAMSKCGKANQLTQPLMNVDDQHRF